MAPPWFFRGLCCLHSVPAVLRWAIRGRSMVPLWWVRGTFMVSPWCFFYSVPMVSLPCVRCPRDGFVVPPWRVRGWSMVPPLWVEGAPVVGPWCLYGRSMASPWSVHGARGALMVCPHIHPWWVHGFSVVSPCCCRGIAVDLPWCFHGETVVPCGFVVLPVVLTFVALHSVGLSCFHGESTGSCLHAASVAREKKDEHCCT